ncbi:zf-HC2 domain-containing protein [Archangium violaceum]|uniref:zf-HC2 domain-containing protein n=1 Tax=Archangium violaceum TaxID=83451 RepID=UPI002B2A265C|nr:zf-HC2 domain-containing protein [Archangium gephyra]
MIITCRQLVEAVTAAREGALSVLDQLSYRAHLARCAACRAYAQQMEETVNLLHDVRTEDSVPDGFKAALLARLSKGTPKH